MLNTKHKKFPDAKDLGTPNNYVFTMTFYYDVNINV